MTYQEIQREECAKEIDTDYGIMRANWKTCERLIKQGDKTECIKFLEYISTMYGEYKLAEFKGDMIDGGIF